MTDSKVSQKEIEKAMGNFMKNAAMPAGMIPPLMNIMGPNAMMPNGMAPVVQMPMAMTQQMPANPQMTMQQMYAMQGVNPMQGGQTQSYKAVGLGTKVRIGTPKERIWGQCSECAKASSYDTKNGELWCNAKGQRVHETGGLVKSTVDINGTKTEAIDADKSCRHFVKM